MATEPLYSNCLLLNPQWIRSLPAMCAEDHPIVVRQVGDRGDRVDAFIPKATKAGPKLIWIGTLPPYETRRCLTMLRSGVDVDASLILAEKRGPEIRIRIYASSEAVAKAHAIASQRRKKKLNEIESAGDREAASKAARSEARKDAAEARKSAALAAGKKAGKLASSSIVMLVKGWIVAARAYWRWLLRVTNP